MRMRIISWGAVLLCLLFFYSGPAFSSDPGPADMTLTSSDSSKKPPAVFPHLQHQEAFECGECHHAMVDGKQAPYTEGMEIQNCEACHNSDVLAGKEKGRYKLDTFKGAGHGNCLECHKKTAKEDKSQRKLRSCKTCHQE